MEYTKLDVIKNLCYRNSVYSEEAFNVLVNMTKELINSKQNKIYVIIGSGNNGKSFYQSLFELLPSELCSRLPSNFLADSIDDIKFSNIGMIGLIDEVQGTISHSAMSYFRENKTFTYNKLPSSHKEIVGGYLKILISTNSPLVFEDPSDEEFVEYVKFESEDLSSKGLSHSWVKDNKDFVLSFLSILSTNIFID
jgi:hypothetical protein